MDIFLHTVLVISFVGISFCIGYFVAIVKTAQNYKGRNIYFGEKSE
jgi:hypothetical protein